jgi:hypothetical protein
MPPYFRMRLTVNEDLLNRLRQLPERSQRNLRRKLATELKPELQADVDELFAEPPPPVSDPFEFGTEKSHIYYILMVRENPILTDGQHWIRTGIIESGFNVEVSDRLRGNLIRIRNIQPDARYVFGPWLVPGHRNTGWPEWVERARPFLQEKMIRRIEEMWAEAVREAIKGQG